MTYAKNLTALFLLLTSLIVFSCKKENNTAKDDETFCAFVSDQNFEATGTLIDNFLAPLAKESKDTQLEKLNTWLNNKSCLESSSIVCHSCILTGPAQSEILVHFLVNGQTITRTLDITMGEPLQFRRFHE